MPLVGIVAKRKDIQVIRKDLEGENIEIIEITRESVKNIKNITFEQIIFLQNIKFDDEEYKYMKEIISKTKYLIFNEDIEIDILKKMKIEKIKLITFGFNSKSTITISSIDDEKIIVCLQRDIENLNGEILEIQEKKIIRKENNKKIYNNLVVFIIKEIYNL